MLLVHKLELKLLWILTIILREIKQNVNYRQSYLCNIDSIYFTMLKYSCEILERGEGSRRRRIRLSKRKVFFMKKTRKILSIVLAVLFVFSSMPVVYVNTAAADAVTYAAGGEGTIDNPTRPVEASGSINRTD